MSNADRLTRVQIAERLAALARELNLDEVYGGGFEPPDLNASPPKNYYLILLCRALSVDGSIRVYGPSSITVFYNTAIRELPTSEKATLRSVEQAEEFLRSRFGSRVAS